LRKWLNNVAVNTLFITPASPWENGYNENFNGKLRDELLARFVGQVRRNADVILWSHRGGHRQW
jgi:transposase InsO family protein